MMFSDDSGASTAPVAQKPTAGMVVGRADLSDEAVLAAIADRLARNGRAAAEAPDVLRAAREGDRAACALMRTLILPAPEARLAMPPQAIRRERRHAAAWPFALLSPRRP